MLLFRRLNNINTIPIFTQIVEITNMSCIIHTPLRSDLSSGTQARAIHDIDKINGIKIKNSCILISQSVKKVTIHKYIINTHITNKRFLDILEKKNNNLRFKMAKQT